MMISSIDLATQCSRLKLQTESVWSHDQVGFLSKAAGGGANSLKQCHLLSNRTIQVYRIVCFLSSGLPLSISSKHLCPSARLSVCLSVCLA